MKSLLTERNIAVVLFVLVVVIFSFAQNETKRIEQLYNGTHTSFKPSPRQNIEANANFDMKGSLSPSAE